VLRALHDRAAAQPVSPEDVHLAIQEAAMGGVPSEDEQGANFHPWAGRASSVP
jgi:hypothetical protein